VKVQMVIYRSGQLGDVTLAASSGRPALDAAALDAVRQAAPFPPAPNGLTEDWYRVAQWMSFRRR
jgi:protein TonB